MNESILSPQGHLLWTRQRIKPRTDANASPEQLHRYAIAIDLASGKDVLDVGCGEGHGSMLLAGKACSVLGIDDSSELIDQARRRYKAKNLRFDDGKLLPESSFDLVVCFEIIQYALDPEIFLGEIRRILRPGGILLLSCSSAPSKGSDPQQLKRLIDESFTHHTWAGQRSCQGSIIYGLTEEPDSQIVAFNKSSSGVDRRVDSSRSHSFLALCSDDPLVIRLDSVFENPKDPVKLEEQTPSVETPTLNHVRDLEKRISRMECSVWWRLRRPLKFFMDLIHGRPASGMFTPRKTPPKPGEKSAGQEVSLLWTGGSDSHNINPPDADVTVVIPACNNFEDLQFCLASVLRFTTARHRIIVVDDCIPDIRVWPMLQELSSHYPQIILYRSEISRGYTASLNYALNLCRQTDVAVVQGNVRVSKKWLHKLAQAASKKPKVATVSPLANRQGIFEIPFKTHQGPLPSSLSVMDIAETVERCSSKLSSGVPITNSACFFVRREALDTIGNFDEENFPGESGAIEDFAAKASAKGFVHLVEDSTFVFQPSSATGSQERNPIPSPTTPGKLAALHPSIDGQNAKWLQNDPLKSLRRDVQNHLSERSKRLNKYYSKESRRHLSNRVLYIVQEGSGGTVLTSEDLIKNISKNYVCYLLRTSFQRWSFFSCEGGELHLLRRFSFTSPWSVDSENDEERRRALDQLLGDFKFSLAHIRHLLGSSPEIIGQIKSHNIPVVFSFHDFYTVCPNIQLLDNFKTFCAGNCSHLLGIDQSQPLENGNSVEALGNASIKGSCPDCKVSTIWPLVTLSQPLKHRYVYEWRKRTARALEQCDGFITTSDFTRQTLLKHFEFLGEKDFRVIEHGRDFSSFKVTGTAPGESKVRVIYFGSLQFSKGAELLTEIMRLDRAGENRFEFHILGSIARSGVDPRKLGAIYHGRYTRDQLSQMAAEINPSFGIVPSMWPETFCHTLTEAWALGLPVFASDIGTLGERVRLVGGGWLMDPQSPKAWYEKMISVSNDPEEYQAKLQAIRKYPLKTIRQMADEYIDLYRHLLHSPAPNSV